MTPLEAAARIIDPEAFHDAPAYYTLALGVRQKLQARDWRVLLMGLLE